MAIGSPSASRAGSWNGGCCSVSPCRRRPLHAAYARERRRVYGVAAVAHGSGFLAVFVAGLFVGDVRAPFKAEIEVFQEALASLAEIVVFVALGLTISSRHRRRRWAEGRVLAAFVAVVAALRRRPLLARHGCVTASGPSFWGGLKGPCRSCSRRSRSRAASTTPGGSTTLSSRGARLGHPSRARTIPHAARRLGVPMRRLYADAHAGARRSHMRTVCP